MYVTSIIRHFHFIVVFDNMHRRVLGVLSLLEIFSIIYSSLAIPCNIMVNCLIKIIAKKKREVKISIVIFSKHACTYTGFGDLGCGYHLY